MREMLFRLPSHLPKTSLTSRSGLECKSHLHQILLWHVSFLALHYLKICISLTVCIMHCGSSPYHLEVALLTNLLTKLVSQQATSWTQVPGTNPVFLCLESCHPSSLLEMVLTPKRQLSGTCNPAESFLETDTQSLYFKG